MASSLAGVGRGLLCAHCGGVCWGGVGGAGGRVASTPAPRPPPGGPPLTPIPTAPPPRPLQEEEIARVKWVQGSVCDDSFVKTLTDMAPDAVIHLAGLQIPTCRANPVLGARVNVIGTLNVFEAAKALKAAGGKPFSIVYASSAAIFGPDEDYATDAVNDSSAPMPASHYGAFKLCCEHAARSYFTDNGISSVGLRPLSVYGPGRDAGLTSFPSRAIAAAVAGVPFEIPFSGPTCYTHVREVSQQGGGRGGGGGGAARFVALPSLVPSAHAPHATTTTLPLPSPVRRWRTSSCRARGRACRAPRCTPSAATPSTWRALWATWTRSVGVRGGAAGGLCPTPRGLPTRTYPHAMLHPRHPHPTPPTPQVLPGAAASIKITGGNIPIASKIDDAALRADVPGLMRIPLPEGIAQCVADFKRLHAEKRLTY